MLLSSALPMIEEDSCIISDLLEWLLAIKATRTVKATSPYDLGKCKVLEDHNDS